MSAPWPSVNALKICKLLLDSSDKALHCYGIKKELKVSAGSAWTSLHYMLDRRWIEKIGESTERAIRYRLTEFGQASAITHLAQLQVSSLHVSA